MRPRGELNRSESPAVGSRVEPRATTNGSEWGFAERAVRVPATLNGPVMPGTARRADPEASRNGPVVSGVARRAAAIEEELAPPPLEWRGVSLDLGAFRLRDVSLALRRGEWVALMGPTGAGKTLLLEVATGFLEPSAGEVMMDGARVTALPPESRGLGYVPQDDLLFPHLDVRGNLLFGARRRERAPDDAERDLAGVAADLEIAHLLGRRVQRISGGEAQRVAMGRAPCSRARRSCSSTSAPLRSMPRCAGRSARRSSAGAENAASQS